MSLKGEGGICGSGEGGGGGRGRWGKGEEKTGGLIDQGFEKGRQGRKLRLGKT